MGFTEASRLMVKALSEIAVLLSGVGLLEIGYMGEKWTAVCLRETFLCVSNSCGERGEPVWSESVPGLLCTIGHGALFR